MIRDTSKRPHRAWLFGGNPDAILAQEATGQRELVNSQQLPTDIAPEHRTMLEQAGVVFGEPCADDPLFCMATLPDGWRKEATEHSMWSLLVDAHGVTRAEIFYKAAFYDRRAFLCVRQKGEAS